MESAMKSQPRVCFEFQVEKIVNMSTDGNFQVQWAPAWVSKFHLVGCEHLIQEFLQEQQGETDIKPYIEETAVYDNLCESQFNQEQLEANGETSSQPLLSCNMDAAVDTATNVETSCSYKYIAPLWAPSNLINAPGTDETSPLKGEYENYHHNKHHYPATLHNLTKRNTGDPHGLDITSHSSIIQQDPIELTSQGPHGLDITSHSSIIQQGPIELTSRDPHGLDITSHSSIIQQDPIESTSQDPHGLDIRSGIVVTLPFTGEQEKSVTASVEPFKLTNNCVESHQVVDKHVSTVKDLPGFKVGFSPTSTEAVESHNLHQLNNILQDSCDQDKPLSKNTSAETVESDNLLQLNNIHDFDKTNSSPKNTCHLCQKVFSNQKNLKRHLKAHSNENHFECPHCPKKFNRCDYLTSHIRVHIGVKLFSCDQCSYSCHQKCSLTAHLRTHTGEKPFSCDVCGKSFAQKANLLRHQHTHTGDKPFSCSHCKYSCYTKGDLGRHMRTHTSEKLFFCNGCQKSFTSQKSLKRHVCNCAKCN